MNVLLCLSYDGTQYHGFQTQKSKKTIQDVLEQGLSSVYGKSMRVITAARTDSGVHAERSFVNFFVDTEHIPPQKVSFALNAKLPRDISVLYSCRVPDSFHARRSAKSRTYYYQFHKGRIVPPVHRTFTVPIDADLDFDLMEKEGKELLGIHDFTSFTVHPEEQGPLIRNMMAFHKEEKGSSLRFYVQANAFLWKMIRTIIGTLARRALERKLSQVIKSSMRTILEARDRSFASDTADARGLCLYNIEYEDGLADAPKQ